MEYVFFVMMVMVCVLISVYDCLFGDMVDVFVMVVVIFGECEDFFVVGMCCYFMFDFRYSSFLVYGEVK